jgi:hypothetical protein
MIVPAVAIVAETCLNPSERAVAELDDHQILVPAVCETSV